MQRVRKGRGICLPRQPMLPVITDFCAQPFGPFPTKPQAQSRAWQACFVFSREGYGQFQEGWSRPGPQKALCVAQGSKPQFPHL